ncbi:hypothetical protein EIP91_005696 [Steccherinum ochraceum]|uniref:Uncharacterized protein n=1 Tax=Steccherinum ochraceum TaxID=92696 RepID=A0A4R0RCW7_9APHY|nr:hypothetical protein EIP91_005696 [Steccherinum ochraceum]
MSSAPSGPATPGEESLAGTIVSHNSYVLLHSRVPPTEFPGKVPSRLQRTLQLHASQWGGVVNFSWSPDQAVHSSTRDAEWEYDQETYRLTAFSRFQGLLEIPEVSSSNLEEVQERLRVHGSPADAAHPASGDPADPNRIHIYVCTHRKRDCRCGDSGVPVYEAFRSEVAKRQLESRVRVGTVGHVGGHKWAANMLVFPSGDWLGNLRDHHVPQVLDAILAQHEEYADYVHAPPLVPHNWRGRMGLSKDQQLSLLAGHAAGSRDLPLRPLERGDQ